MPADLLIRDATVVSCDAGRRVLQDSAIAIVAGRIAAIGPTAELDAAYASLPRFEARGLGVLPGLVNAHSHTVLNALKGTVEDWSGEAIYNYMTPISYAMTGEERAAVAVLGCVEAIRSGTTTVVDPFRHVATYAEAMAGTGLRLWLSEACADIDTRRIRHGDYSIDPAFGDAFFERSMALVERFHGSHGDRLRCQIAAHAPDNCSPAILKRLKDAAERLGLSRTIHLSQSMGEEAAVLKRTGLSSTAYLAQEGFLGPDLLAAHLTFCQPEDIALLARHGVRMAHTPASISRRGMHKALLGTIRDAGIEVALGTDNMSADMFQALAFGSILHRTGRGREVEGGVAPQPQDMLDMATRHGAAAVGALHEVGSIEVGKKADLAVLNLRSPSLRPAIRLVSNIVHYGHPGTVHSVLVEGEFLMREGRLLTVDEDAVVDRAEQVVREVWRRMVADNPDIRRPAGEIPWLDDLAQ
ncbi:amidohydrolase family protein [Xylophilus rhododendri]|uniref:Amidohydrolase family protein n=1 Tax=Xylophilus rhododendri TaxID=2697032 RepID=A0A857J0U3_9BURK|nr:amidohydrolase family protein [Xylophilus rhododendri]QHI97494.1 amidohydrolase family protein [Xylophilus rhododendri]